MISVEGYWELMKDPGHWYFEITLMLLFDVLIGYVGFKVLWPKIKAHIHKDVASAKRDVEEHLHDDIRLDPKDWHQGRVDV